MVRISRFKSVKIGNIKPGGTLMRPQFVAWSPFYLFRKSIYRYGPEMADKFKYVSHLIAEQAVQPVS